MTQETTQETTPLAHLDLWQRFLERGDLTARQTLVEHYVRIVKYVAGRMAIGLPHYVEYNDLVSAGLLGLIQAIDNFDHRRGIKFETYAIPRIRGAILDELRRQDHVPRSIRRKTREIGAARESLMRTLGRRPEDAEIAQQLDVDVSTIWRWQAEVESAVHVPLDRTGGDSDTLTSAPADYLSASEDSADVRMAKEEEIAILREAIGQLKDQERTVLSLCYFEELKLHEIAEILGLTESRVSQIRSKALTRLREKLKPMRAA